MSPSTMRELTTIVARRYLKAKSKLDKSRILDEFCANAGLHRKYAISKIRKLCFGRPGIGKRGRKKIYSAETDAVLIEVWQAFNCICAERLHPYLQEGITKLRQFGHLRISPEGERQLLQMSRATIARRLHTHRKLNIGLPFSTTKPGSLLKKNIPIQTQRWDVTKAGFTEMDLVAHCGGSTDGDFINTLQLVDIKTTWTERVAVMGKNQQVVFVAIKKIRKQLPFDLLGMDSDNGGEFINYILYRYCRSEKIAFTRSRPYMSKDNAHIEQKNYPLVRKILGYERYDTPAQLRLINDLYDNELRLYLNFFQPSLKLKSKERIGSRYKRKYESAKTPYQRVLDCKELSKGQKQILRDLYASLDPVQLLQIIQRKLRVIASLLR